MGNTQSSFTTHLSAQRFRSSQTKTSAKERKSTDRSTHRFSWKPSTSSRETTTTLVGGPGAYTPGAANLPGSTVEAWVPASLEPDPVYMEFVEEYPEYRLTWSIDELRHREFKRLHRTQEAYVDYMGGALYPESLVTRHAVLLSNSTLGNTHSVSNSSSASARYAEEARNAVLAFFHAPPDYTVVFTANASAALKLVGEAYDFSPESSFVLCSDSHNSVHGIRQFATRLGAKVCYIASTAQGGVDELQARTILSDHKPNSGSSLFALTGQSNISNTKCPLSLIDYASSLGYETLLDAAALAPTSVISLAENPVDAMAISFYKMFGYPTGVGALVVKKSFLTRLKRPWFAGGTVDVVQVPGHVLTRALHLHEQFEDGTINYLSLPAITNGLRFLSSFLPLLPLRLSALIHYLTSRLDAIKHPSTGSPAVRILSQRLTRRLHNIGDQLDTGAILSFLFLAPNGEMIPNSFVEHAASTHSISLRTGCMCNPGGAAALLGLEPLMARLSDYSCNITLAQFEDMAGHELGVVRVSLGLVSDFSDVRRVIQFAEKLADEHAFAKMWDEWKKHGQKTSGFH